MFQFVRLFQGYSHIFCWNMNAFFKQQKWKKYTKGQVFHLLIIFRTLRVTDDLMKDSFGRSYLYLRILLPVWYISFWFVIKLHRIVMNNILLCFLRSSRQEGKGGCRLRLCWLLIRNDRNPLASINFGMVLIP